jgi:hypothetical protein
MSDNYISWQWIKRLTKDLQLEEDCKLYDEEAVVGDLKVQLLSPEFGQVNLGFEVRVR